jgi:hypothetical protein
MTPQDEQDLENALRAEFETACREAPVPNSGGVWWRATIRVRAEAARTAGQPITAIQGIAAAVTIGAVAGLGGLVWRSVSMLGRYSDVIDLVQSRRSDIEAASSLIASHGFPLLLALAGCLIVAPLAVYLATVDD